MRVCFLFLYELSAEVHGLSRKLLVAYDEVCEFAAFNAAAAVRAAELLCGGERCGGDGGSLVYAEFQSLEQAVIEIGGGACDGALVGFLWYNGFPAQIFMGDTGSLTIGGVIAVFALCIRKELLLPLLCGVFLVEALSVMIQVSYFKYTKSKYGEGRRIFLMSPLHHHYQKKEMFETKIVLRFWIISLLLAAMTLVTLKIR